MRLIVSCSLLLLILSNKFLQIHLFFLIFKYTKHSLVKEIPKRSIFHFSVYRFHRRFACIHKHRCKMHSKVSTKFRLMWLQLKMKSFFSELFHATKLSETWSSLHLFFQRNLCFLFLFSFFDTSSISNRKKIIWSLKPMKKKLLVKLLRISKLDKYTLKT